MLCARYLAAEYLMNNFQFEFDGEIQAGQLPGTVQLKLAALFGVPVEHLDALMQGSQTFTRSAIDATTAELYLKMFLDVGAIGKVERVADSHRNAENKPQASQATSFQPKAADDNKERCPKCTSLEIADGRCGTCGIFIKKYLCKQSSDPIVREESPTSDDHEASTNRHAAVKWLSFASTAISALAILDYYLSQFAVYSVTGFDMGITPYLLAHVGLLYGCYLYAISKGYSDIVGALGLLSFAGLSILLLLPDKTNRSAGRSPKQVVLAIICIGYSVFWASNLLNSGGTAEHIKAAAATLPADRNAFPNLELDSNEAIYQAEQDEIIMFIHESLATVVEGNYRRQASVDAANAVMQALADYKNWKRYQAYLHRIRGQPLPPSLRDENLRAEGSAIVGAIEAHIDFRAQRTPLSETVVTWFIGDDPSSYSNTDIEYELSQYVHAVDSQITLNSKSLMSRSSEPDFYPKIDLTQLVVTPNSKFDVEVTKTTITFKVRVGNRSTEYLVVGYSPVARSRWSGPKYSIGSAIIDTNIPNKRLKLQLNTFSDWVQPGATGR